MNMRVTRLAVVGCAAIGLFQLSSYAGELSFMMWSTGTFFTISSSGRVDVQFGSSVGDHAYLPEGSVDYDLVRALLPKASPTPQSQGLIAIEGEAQSRSMQDAAAAIYAICSHSTAWRLDPVGEIQRVRKLLDERVISRCQRIKDEMR